MDGTNAAGSVHAHDHDSQFKELLTTFFAEFLFLFFPRLAESMDPHSLVFLNQEHIVSLTGRKSYRADIVAKARFKDREAFFVIHVEHQSTAPTDFPRRFFRYFSAIFEKHNLPVYPIVVYSHDLPRKAQPNVFRVAFQDGEVLRFRYRVVQLNRLRWRSFLKSQNPVASALMAKMRIAERDRPRVKAECLRLMLTLKLDPARMHLISSFVDAYLRLSETEERAFQEALDEMELDVEQKEELVSIITSWEERGIRKGIEQGLQKGLQKGLQQGIEQGLQQGLEKGLQQGAEALREILLDVLSSRFGQLDAPTIARVQQIDSVDALKQLTHKALAARALDEVGL